MRKNAGVLLTILFIAGSTPQSGLSEMPTSQQQAKVVVSKEKRPQLAVEYSSTTKLKLASRKLVYRLDEMITVDIAVLNDSAEALYIPIPDYPDISVKNNSGFRVEARLNTIFRPLTPELYALVPPGEVVTHVLQASVGCEPASGRMATTDGRARFESGSFVFVGRGCIKMDQPGSYEISAELHNESVVVHSQSRIKTVVGTIKSEPLTITVVECRPEK